MQDGGADKLEALLGGGVYQALWRYCRGLAPTREDAEDLLQDCLASALLKLGQLRDTAVFKAWLFTIARRCYLDLRRGRAWRERAAAARLEYAKAGDAAGQTSADSSGLAAAAGSVARAGISGESLSAAGSDPHFKAQLEALRAELPRLPLAQREVLELHYLHGLSLEEVAKVLGISGANARQRGVRGREALRRALAGDGQNMRTYTATAGAEEEG